MEKVKLTKNLKLKIKNAQLTKSAGLDKLKQKLAQAGSSEIKKALEKPATSTQDKTVKEKVSKKKIPVDVVAPANTEPLHVENSPRRIRAKNRSSFASEDLIETASVSLESDSIESSPIIEETAAPFAESQEQEEVTNNKPATEMSSFIQEKLEPAQNKTEISPPKKTQELEEQNIERPAKRVVSIKSNFGPTGKHINHLLSKTFKSAPKKEDRLAPKERPGQTRSQSSSQEPSSDDKNNTANTTNNHNKLSTSTSNRSAQPSHRKDSSGNKKTGIDLRDRAKKDAPKAFTGRDRYGLNDNSEDDKWRKKRVQKTKKHYDESTIQRPTHIKVPLPITIKDLASEMKLKASELIQKMFIQGLLWQKNYKSLPRRKET